MFDILRRALARQLGVLRQECRQFKRFEVMIEKQLGDIVHAASPSRLIWEHADVVPTLALGR
jgi:hypothetical protein